MIGVDNIHKNYLSKTSWYEPKVAKDTKVMGLLYTCICIIIPESINQACAPLMKGASDHEVSKLLITLVIM